MAARNLRRQPHRTIALGGAVAFSALVMTLVSGFVNGMDRAIQDNVTLYSAGHVIVSGYTASWSGRFQNRFAGNDILEELQRAWSGAKAVLPLSQARAAVVYGSREIQLSVRGIRWDRDQLYKNALILLQGTWDEALKPRSMVMSSQVASRFGLSTGDEVLVRLSTASGQQNVTEYRVAAVYDDSAAGGMSTAFVAFEDLAADLNLQAQEQQAAAVFLDSADQAETAADRAAAALKGLGYQVLRQSGAESSGMAGTVLSRGASDNSASAAGVEPVMRRAVPGTVQFRIATVQELAGEIGAALGSVRWIGYAVFALMLVVSAAGIANSYRMVLLERMREIGMLRCIGFRKRDVFALFLAEGVLLAGTAAFAGALAGIPVGLAAGLIPFNPHGDFGAALVQGHLRFLPTAGQILLIVLFETMAAAGAVFFPARKAAAVLPVEALRKTA